MNQQSGLDARYGRTRAAAGRTRWIAIGAAAAFALAFAAWLIWGGLGGSPAQFQVRDTGHEILGDSSVEVRWTITVEPGTPMRCALQAQNSAFGIVGWKEVDVPASDTWTRDFTDTVRTSEEPVTGLIYRCWLI